MVDKEPHLTSKQIQADLQTQGTTVSARSIRRYLNEKGHAMLGDPGGQYTIHCGVEPPSNRPVQNGLIFNLYFGVFSDSEWTRSGMAGYLVLIC